MIDINKLDFEKNPDGLLPAIIQDWVNKDVRMLGYMNRQALEQTIQSKKVTFYSRSKKRLWQKGETSGNTLHLVSLQMDCDADTLLIQVRANGPTCHKGTQTCFNDVDQSFLDSLETIIEGRKQNPQEDSYVSSLFKKGVDKIAQKVGEEAVEVVIEAKNDNENDFLNESADLLFHYLILLKQKSYSLEDVVKVLRDRHTIKEQH